MIIVTTLTIKVYHKQIPESTATMEHPTLIDRLHHIIGTGLESGTPETYIECIEIVE